MPRSIVPVLACLILATSSSAGQDTPSASSYAMQNWATSGGSVSAQGDGFEVEVAVNQPFQDRAESARFIFFAGVVAPTDLLFANDFE